MAVVIHRPRSEPFVLLCIGEGCRTAERCHHDDGYRKQECSHTDPLLSLPTISRRPLLGNRERMYAIVNGAASALAISYVAARRVDIAGDRVTHRGRPQVRGNLRLPCPG